MGSGLLTLRAKAKAMWRTLLTQLRCKIQIYWIPSSQITIGVRGNAFDILFVTSQ